MDNEELQKQINALRKQLEQVSTEVYKNNFSSRQDFNKASAFNTKLKVPSYTSVPAKCEVGEIIENNGKLLICSTSNNWVIIGTQS
jgi:hypothetical protein